MVGYCSIVSLAIVITLEMPADAISVDWCSEEDLPHQLRPAAAIFWTETGTRLVLPIGRYLGVICLRYIPHFRRPHDWAGLSLVPVARIIRTCSSFTSASRSPAHSVRTACHNRSTSAESPRWRPTCLRVRFLTLRPIRCADRNTNPKRQRGKCTGFLTEARLTSLALFVVAQFSIAPKGQRQISLGQRPRGRDEPRNIALKGRNMAGRLLRPFRAIILCFSRKFRFFPGRCPGLICSAPVGQETKRRNIKTGASG
jgi:hypothetical protein